MKGKDCQKLQEALLDAFRSTSKFKQFLYFEFEENLDTISNGENHSEDIFNVIQYFDSHGIISKLIEKAHEYNPGNPKLKDFVEEWCKKTFVQEKAQDYKVNPNNIKPETEAQNSFNYLISDEQSNSTNQQQTTANNQKYSSFPPIEQRIKDLEALLGEKKWKEADEETSNILLQAVGQEEKDCLEPEDIEQLDCNLLLKIDKIWIKYSQNCFGFSVQKEICEQLPQNNREEEFAKKVAWFNEINNIVILRSQIEADSAFVKQIKAYLPTPPPCRRGPNVIKVYLTLAIVEKLTKCKLQVRN